MSGYSLTQVEGSFNELELLGTADEPDEVLEREVDDDYEVDHIDGVDEGGVVIVTKLIVLIRQSMLSISIQFDFLHIYCLEKRRHYFIQWFCFEDFKSCILTSMKFETEQNNTRKNTFLPTQKLIIYCTVPSFFKQKEFEKVKFQSNILEHLLLSL